ncbi:MAG: pyridoxamine 5'-phosphate oxidase family protein [Caldilineaceae bacterium]
MGKTYESIDDKLANWVKAQQMFFVSTAPLADDGLVNCSPKGGSDTFAILDAHTVAYLDFTGSGVETVAHLKENGRIVIMFCAFNGPANIVRFHGAGEVIEPHHPDFNVWRASPIHAAMACPNMSTLVSAIRWKNIAKIWGQRACALISLKTTSAVWTGCRAWPSPPQHNPHIGLPIWPGFSFATWPVPDLPTYLFPLSVRCDMLNTNRRSLLARLFQLA